MKPFELFIGVKDNPLPYEKRHQKMQKMERKGKSKGKS